MPLVILFIGVVVAILYFWTQRMYKKLEEDVLKALGFSNWNIITYNDANVTVKSRQAFEKYDEIKFFKENSQELPRAKSVIKEKTEVGSTIKEFLENNEYKSNFQYRKVVDKRIKNVLICTGAYRINVKYVSSSGNVLGQRTICVTQHTMDRINRDPSLLMGKGEYSKFLKEQQKEALAKKHEKYYSKVNCIIDTVNNERDSLVVKGSKEQMDKLVGQLFDKTVNSIKKIKTTDSEEWKIIGDFIDHTDSEVNKIISNNKRILDYYDSPDFSKIKETCETLMSSQRDFNEYIIEKVQSISELFGTRVVRNETVNEDEYNYIRPYKKTITPFTAEVSATVFASAENSPLEYVVKYFYPNKAVYPEQIRKLYTLVEELETLREAKQIIENYKVEYQQYLGDVPRYVMEQDEAGFYSRLGFANIDESVLSVEYEFSYTSNGGMARRTFGVPMTEETIAELIHFLENKLTASAFAKEQRSLMTKKLRLFIKDRDNYTCCNCGNSTHEEPNLLLEIDHIIPVSKGGCTVEENLQTLCWRCNRAKSNRIME